MTPERMRRRCWAVVVVCGVLVLGACGEGSSATPTTPATTSPAPTAEPTPDPTVEPTPVVTDRAGEPLVPPVRPAAMDNDDEAGARAAAEYFVELYGYAVQSQDLADFSAFCDTASNFCSGVTAEVGADRSAGIRTEGGVAVLATTRIDPPVDHPFYTVWGKVERDPFVVIGADGSTILDSPGESGVDFVAFAEWQPAGGWIIRGAEAGVVPPS